MAPVRIGIIGDFNPQFETHVQMEPAAKEAAERIGVDLQVAWIPTPALAREKRDQLLSQFDALWAAAASFSSHCARLKGSIPVSARSSGGERFGS